MIYGGDGLARLPADDKGPGKVVLVPFVLEGERVTAQVVEDKPGYARARVEKVLAPSAERVEPGCPYFLRCGGCHYQHASYDHQLQMKSDILRETLRRTAKVEVKDVYLHPSQPWNYRNRTRMKLQAGQRPQEFLLGYHKYGSHDLLPVEECPISSPLINRAIAALWELGRAGSVSPEVFEVEFFADAADEQLMVELSARDQKPRRKPPVEQFVTALRQRMPEVVGVALFRQNREGALVRQDIPEERKSIFGAEQLVYKTRAANYTVSAGSFFQTNRYLTDELVSLVTANRSGAYVLDLYAGTGLFSLILSQSFREVAAVESAPFAFHDLKRNCPSNVVAFRTTAEHFLTHLPPEVKFDMAVVDPPRAGIGERPAQDLAETEVPWITYVSCDPATLARDLRVFLEAGYQLVETHLVDLFPQTFHIESVVHLVR